MVVVAVLLLRARGRGSCTRAMECSPCVGQNTAARTRHARECRRRQGEASWLRERGHQQGAACCCGVVEEPTRLKGHAAHTLSGCTSGRNRVSRWPSRVPSPAGRCAGGRVQRATRSWAAALYMAVLRGGRYREPWGVVVRPAPTPPLQLVAVVVWKQLWRKTHVLP